MTSRSPGAAASPVAPIIVTLRFDETSFAHFDAMRRRHFPAKRNVIPAHLTLFHALPGERADEVLAVLGEAAETTPTAVRLAVTGLRFLGYGCAYEVAAPALSRLRGDLARRFADDLTRQDAQGFRPHVTIQNKAPAAEARALFERLDAAFRPFEATGTGLIAWRYRGGPWEEIAAVGFGAQTS